MNLTIKMGQELRDPSTGFQGIATLRTELWDGTVQWGLQPQFKVGEKELPEVVYFDDNLLEVVGDGISAKAVEEDSTVTLNVREKARDTVTGYSGTLTERTTFLNGCVYFILQPKHDIKKVKAGFDKGVLFSHLRLKRIGKPIPPISKKAPSRPVAKQGPGGPVRRASEFQRS